MSTYHIPVLLKECIDGLNVQPKGVYVDATYGGGGYSLEILKKLGGGKLFSFDMDEEASANLPDSKMFYFILGNFRFVKNYLKYYGIHEVDGIVADLGVSSRHFDHAERGFTYRKTAALDMRMNLYSNLTAEIVINDYEAKRLIRIFREYGELLQADKLVKMIVDERKKNRIKTNMQLISCIRALIPKRTENQFLSRVFQAMRIEVNRELENLTIFLSSSGELLKRGGKLAVVSYHSLEDRMVKNFMKWGNTIGPPQKDVYGRWTESFTVLTKKPVVPGREEITLNPRSKSARLRIAMKK